MYVADNYGSKWVKGIINWFRTKTLEGIPYTDLIIQATLECGLRRNKLIELVNEYVETGLLRLNEGSVYWVDINIKPSETVMNKNIPVIPVEREKRKKKRKETKKTLQEKLVDYNEYTEYCKSENEKPLDYEVWLKDVFK